MKYLYVPSSNTSTNGKQINPTVGANPAHASIEVKTLIVGAPVTSANIWIYDEVNPVNGSTSNIAVKLTLPATLATGQLPFTVDLTDQQGRGLLLYSGGAVIIDQTLQLTVGWDFLDDASGR